MPGEDWTWTLAAWPEEHRQPWWPKILPDLRGFEPVSPTRVLKDDPSGRVTLHEVDGSEVVVKSPSPPAGSRRWISPFRKPRAKRAFDKATRLLAAGLPVELPIGLGRQGRRWVGVYALVPGQTLAGYTGPDRQAVLRRVGRLLRQTTAAGWVHSDAKTTNWIITPDGQPVLCDCDGLKPIVFRARERRGLERVLRDVRTLGTFQPGDEAALLEGFDAAVP